MSTARPFAYNTSGPIDGTTQVGDLAVGTPTSGFTNSPQFWNGPDEELGYVIAVPVSGNTQPTPVPGVTASIGFYSTDSLDDNQFIGLAEYVSITNGTPQTFTAATDASTWLTTNGFWNSYGGAGWFLYNVYNDAPNNGEITFPNHSAGSGDLNPNHVGQIIPGYATQIYINLNDSAGVSYGGTLSQLVGNYGTLTLTQGSQNVTYSFTNNAFENNGGEVFADNNYGNSVVGSVTVLHPSSNDFNTTDSISISQTIFPSSYTFTIDSSMLNGLASVGNSIYGSANGTSGFDVSSQINNLNCGVYGQLNNTTAIQSAFNAVSAVQNGQGYIMMVQWGGGSTIEEGLAKVSYNTFNQQFVVTSVDSADNDFTIQNTNAGSNLTGTFNFPATFTFITPLIHKNDWC